MWKFSYNPLAMLEKSKQSELISQQLAEKDKRPKVAAKNLREMSFSELKVCPSQFPTGGLLAISLGMIAITDNT